MRISRTTTTGRVAAASLACAALLSAFALPCRPARAVDVPEAAGRTEAGDPAGAGEGLPAEPRAAEDRAGPPAGEETLDDIEEAPGVADPLEPLNRALFVVNDKAYFWIMKPVARGYRAVVPEGARVSVRNFFLNLGMPIRFVNSLLQGKVRGAGTELLRFTINSTIGLAGLFDPAAKEFRLARRDEDLGQTFGRYGLGHGMYIVLPLLGPSSLRDAAGLAGDSFLDPVNYLGDTTTVFAVNAFKAENEISLRIGEYEDLKASAIDPYVALRDAYVQHRRKKVRE